MFARCPNCQKVLSVTAEQLRMGRGIAFCRYCSIKFDALETLGETTDDVTKLILPTELLPWTLQARRNHWQIGVSVSLLLLIMQLAYFNSTALLQNVHLRPSLETVCHFLDCELPTYQQTEELELQGNLTAMADRHVLTAQIVNHALFAQPYPKLILTLLDFNGQPFSYRIFQPHDYAPSLAPAGQINPGVSLAVNLEIMAMQTHIGGYTFDLRY